MDSAALRSPADGLSQSQELSDKLDADIARVRSEIQSLTKRKNLLTSSLLSSTQFQSQLAAHSNNAPQSNVHTTDRTPLQLQAQHNSINIHRLAFGVTSFPFTDPNPDTSDTPLLGIRFDIPSRSGKFEKAPYYIFLKQAQENEPLDGTTETSNNHTTSKTYDLKIHHHTIPALVPLQDYELRYLPQTVSNPASNHQRRDEGHFSPAPADDHDIDESLHDDDNTATIPAQNLNALVTAVRHDLISWQLRSDAISLLAEQLHLSNAGDDNNDSDTGRLLLQSVQATAIDARFCRLVWQNGTVGRLRLTDDGYIDRAVVIGDGGDGGIPDRMKDVERMLCTGKDGARLVTEELRGRLEEVETWMKRGVENRLDNNVYDDVMEEDDTTEAHQ